LPRTEEMDAMRSRRRWSDLSERSRRLIVVAAVVEGLLKLAASTISGAARPARSAGGSGSGRPW